MNKIVEIFKSWGMMYNPSQEFNEIASERIQICDGCEYKTKNAINVYTCAVCGCALQAKVYSPRFDACPEHKWLQVEKKHKNILK